ncbi:MULTISPECIES: multidrug efflux SMR transporter [unclassified Caballeronia]|uniref:DMT family transporter n=1 Tax=unclassified Caballeronia TaxID=2646786 RepID=UPI0028679877|nr:MULTISPECIES: multidrug efflux SMR transporter [unclassified Caballeronia]MDR5740620.1 multidrug efflux SMR transporter [Caballeronia sp. LZ016]MDR5808857.1 multidrug efflux SMR transporter [Caballeronia sp. LZ019]
MLNDKMSAYAALFIAILLEIAGTTCLQKSDQFTKLVPTLAMAACYLGAFYFLSIVLKTIPVGLAYAIWSGLGIVLISTVSFFVFRQRLDAPAVLGLGFIVLGVVIINVFSTAKVH